ncbi:hypothetical protein [Microcoleus vaginatus]|uniref:hypothetical protein n=1 Tax=Microcoleus vaginatus TaxID=119532 RepID=UPI001F610352|nr:hypothetical protein D0A37_19020 [Microcoleus vaginatus HSN003]
MLIDLLIDSWHVAVQFLFSIPGITIALLDAETDFFYKKVSLQPSTPVKKPGLLSLVRPS